MKSFFGPIWALTRANLLRFFRDKTYIFFIFLLPVMFLFVFGMLYRNDFSGFSVAIFDESGTGFGASMVEKLMHEDGVLERVDVEDREDADQQLVRGGVLAIIVLPEGFGELNEMGVPSGEIEVIYNMGRAEAGNVIISMLEAITTEMSNQMVGHVPSLTVRAEADGYEGLSMFDYVFAGLLGYTVMSIGMMGLAFMIPTDKGAGTTRRLRATSVRPVQLIMGYASTFLVLGVLNLALMIVLGLVVFDFNMRGGWVDLGLFLALSTFMMMGIGLLIGGVAKNEAQANAAANLAMFPMMFLSGVFFPLFMLPEVVQAISQFIPLTPIVEGIQLISTEGFGLLEILPQIGIVGLWIVGIYLLASKLFRWE